MKRILKLNIENKIEMKDFPKPELIRYDPFLRQE
jgi:hypothetical protein